MALSSEIINLQNQTTAMQAQQTKKTGSEQEYGQDMFLKLMLEQLKYQDPLEPTGSTEFLQQQAMFTQVSELQKLNKEISNNNQLMQASLMIDKQVILTDPSNSSKEISGIVTSVGYNGKEATIEVNGKNYPLSSVKTIKSMTWEYIPPSDDKTTEATENNTPKKTIDKTEKV